MTTTDTQTELDALRQEHRRLRRLIAETAVIIGDQYPTVVSGASDVELVLEFRRLITDQRAKGRVLESWNMNHERFADGVSEYLIVAVFRQEWTPGRQEEG